MDDCELEIEEEDIIIDDEPSNPKEEEKIIVKGSEDDQKYVKLGKEMAKKEEIQTIE
jgi:hypothetical protein